MELGYAMDSRRYARQGPVAERPDFRKGRAYFGQRNNYQVLNMESTVWSHSVPTLKYAEICAQRVSLSIGHFLRLFRSFLMNFIVSYVIRVWTP
jgi:hypothetical protein